MDWETAIIVFDRRKFGVRLAVVSDPYSSFR